MQRPRPLCGQDGDGRRGGGTARQLIQPYGACPPWPTRRSPKPCPSTPSRRGPPRSPGKGSRGGVGRRDMADREWVWQRRRIRGLKWRRRRGRWVLVGERERWMRSGGGEQGWAGLYACEQARSNEKQRWNLHECETRRRPLMNALRGGIAVASLGRVEAACVKKTAPLTGLGAGERKQAKTPLSRGRLGLSVLHTSAPSLQIRRLTGLNWSALQKLCKRRPVCQLCLTVFSRSIAKLAVTITI